MKGKKTEKKDRLLINSGIAIMFGEMMSIELMKRVQKRELTSWKIISNGKDGATFTDLPSVIAINENENTNGLQARVFVELKEVEKTILQNLGITEEEYEKSVGGLKIAFGKRQMERWGL